MTWIGSFLLGLFSTLLIQRLSRPSSCTIALGTYKGREYEPPSHQRECLVESKYLKVQQHTVTIPGSNPPVTVADWLWIDYHDRINVLVQLASNNNNNSNNKEPTFLIFEQTKYALEGKVSLAIVGGIVEPGEQATATAPREVREETGMECATPFVPLGRYRTDVNRGMGWTHTFLAQDCHPVGKGTAAAGSDKDEVGGHDTERQDTKEMTLEELRHAVQKGEFMEIQWSATVALAIMHIDENNSS